MDDCSLGAERPKPAPSAPFTTQLLVTKRDLSEAGLGSQKHIDRLVAAGLMPAPVRVGKRALRWSRIVIEEWIAGGCKAVEVADQKEGRSS